MKTIVGGLAAVGVVVALLGAGVMVLRFSSWIERSAVASPDGSQVAFVLRSGSEGGLAPYGDHVIVRPTGHFLRQYFAEPVFAAYCRGGAGVSWKTDTTLVIKCSAEKVVRQRAVHGPIQVEYASADQH